MPSKLKKTTEARKASGSRRMTPSPSSRELGGLLVEAARSGSDEQRNQLSHRILDQSFELAAVRAIEHTAFLIELLGGERRKDSKSAGVQDWLSGLYSRLLMRLGHYGRVRQFLQRGPMRERRRSNSHGILAAVHGDMASAQVFFARALELGGDGAVLRLFFEHASARTIFLQRDGGQSLESSVGAVEKLLPLLAHEDQAGWVTSRHAEVLRLAGRPHESLKLCRARIDELESDRREGIPVSPLTLAEVYIELARASHESGAPSAEVTRAVDAAQELYRLESQSYPFLFRLLQLRIDLNLSSDANMHLLKAMHGRLSISDPLGRFAPRAKDVFQDDRLTSRSRFKLSVDLSSDEYRLKTEDSPRLGCPLELQLVAWVALISPVAEAPRTLLIDLLWPDWPAPIDQLQLRLTKLLSRAETVLGLRLRRDTDGAVRMANREIEEIQVGLGAPGRTPSYFRQAEVPSVAGLARYYGLSKRQALRWMVDARDQGWLPEPGRQEEQKKKAA